MTYPYEWNPMPHFVDVRCPDCGGHATFEFAEAIVIRRRQDIPYFKNSELFDYHLIPGNYTRPGNRHVAIYYHGLHRRSLDSVTDLPEGYSPADWNHSRYWYRSYDVGTLTCDNCHRRQKHELDWPRDAFFQTAVRGKVLWAFNRDSLIALRDYVAASHRHTVRKPKWTGFLMKVPSHFLSAKVRDEVFKKLNRLIGE